MLTTNINIEGRLVNGMLKVMGITHEHGAARITCKI